MLRLCLFLGRPMLSSVNKDNLLILLDKFSDEYKQLTSLQQSPHNYTQLKQSAIALEFIREYEQVCDLLKTADATTRIQQFKILCSQREMRIQNTCLSFQACPESPTNRLYWSCALELFQPQSLAEMIQILLPSIRGQLSVDLSVILRHQIPRGGARLAVCLKQTAIQFAERSFDISCPSVLSQFVVSDNLIFNIEDVCLFPLKLQIQLYRKLMQYPQLKEKLYQHNDDFRTLAHDIKYIEQNGITPAEALGRLSQSLILSGSRFSGKELAEDSAMLACAEFRSYLDGLPKAFAQQLMRLKSAHSSRCLGDLLHKLETEPDHCVETTAEDIVAIKSYSANQAQLLQIPYVSPQQLQSLHKKHRKRQLNIVGFDVSLPIPVHLRTELLQKLEISSAYDYLDLLISVPVSQLDIFLLSCNISCEPSLPYELASGLSMLNAIQREKFFEIIVQHPEQFGGLSAVLRFSAMTGEVTFFDAVCSTHAEVKAASKGCDAKKNGLLHAAAHGGCPQILTRALSMIATSRHQQELNKKNSDYMSPLYILSGSGTLAAFKDGLSILDENTREFAFLESNDNDEIMLFYPVRSSNIENAKYIIQNHPKCHLADYLRIQNKDGDAVIHIIARYADLSLFAEMAAELTEPEFEQVLNDKSQDGDTPLHIIAEQGNPERLQQALNLIPAAKRASACDIKNAIGETVFDILDRQQSLEALDILNNALDRSVYSKV